MFISASKFELFNLLDDLLHDKESTMYELNLIVKFSTVKVADYIVSKSFFVTPNKDTIVLACENKLHFLKWFEEQFDNLSDLFYINNEAYYTAAFHGSISCLKFLKENKFKLNSSHISDKNMLYNCVKSNNIETIEWCHNYLGYNFDKTVILTEAVKQGSVNFINHYITTKTSILVNLFTISISNLKSFKAIIENDLIRPFFNISNSIILDHASYEVVIFLYNNPQYIKLSVVEFLLSFNDTSFNFKIFKFLVDKKLTKDLNIEHYIFKFKNLKFMKYIYNTGYKFSTDSYLIFKRMRHVKFLESIGVKCYDSTIEQLNLLGRTRLANYLE